MTEQKMALIDKDLLLRLLGRVNPRPPINPELREMGRAERELDDVISRKASSNQAKEIGHIISKHNFHKTNYENTPEGPPTLTRHLPTSSILDDAWASKTVDATPEKFQRNARSLLDHIKNSGRLGWDRDGQFVTDGKVLRGTNILDLVHSVVRPRRTSGPPEGAAEFLAALEAVNTPRELIQNAQVVRKKLNKQPIIKRSKLDLYRRVISTPLLKKKKKRPDADATPGAAERTLVGTPDASASPTTPFFSAHKSWERIKDN